MHATFTSGAARRRDITLTAAGMGRMIATPADLTAINNEHDRKGRINPILDLLRDEWDGHEAHAIAVEYLFQLARHWSEWQSERIGTFPLDYRDYAGPLPRKQSEASGEDRTYWEINDVLYDDAILHGSSDRTQDLIVHATAVLDRIYEATKDDA
jgi:hypothetical protein